jgi:GNAT superfamily N-acetyltransferase
MAARQISIRPAQARDVPALADLMGQLGYPISLEDMHDRLVFVMASPADELFVAEADGRVVGCIGAHIMDFVHRVGRCGFITAMVVSSEHRRRGLGTKLLDYLEEWLRDQGVRYVRVNTGSYRKDDAFPFYEARGYQQNGVRFVKTLDD